MRTPDRILRADAQDLERDPPAFTPREQEQYNRILALSEGIMARRGIHTMTFSGLARALCMGSATVRRYFCDLDILLATLIRRHLRKLAGTIRDVPPGAPDRPQKMRAAYLAYTRSDLGLCTDAHLLLVRDRHLLPEDLLTPLEVIRRNLGELLAHGHAETALGLLDMLTLDAAGIESALASVIAAAAKQPKSAPAAPKPSPIATAPLGRDRPRPAAPPWAPRDPLALLRFGPVPTLPNLPALIARPLVHSSA
jgi:AcrR family transcriptional regulator